MEMFQGLPEATGYKISSSDMEELMMNLMSGRDEVPESFNAIFNIDMIDIDCIDVVSNLPGVGDVLAPLLAGFDAQMSGATGTSAFGGAVDNPAWIDRS